MPFPIQISKNSKWHYGTLALYRFLVRLKDIQKIAAVFLEKHNRLIGMNDAKVGIISEFYKNYGCFDRKSVKSYGEFEFSP